jgi:hypothetical protein
MKDHVKITIFAWFMYALWVGTIGLVIHYIFFLEK